MTDEITTPAAGAAERPAPSSSGRNRSRIAKVTGAAAAVAALAIPVGWAIGPVSAQDDTTTTTDSPAPDTEASPGGHGAGDAARAGTPTAEQRHARQEARRAERESLVAEKLGVTPEELRAARLGVLHDKLQERVGTGRISQDRADEILQAAKDGRLRELRRQLRRERIAARNGDEHGGS